MNESEYQKIGEKIKDSGVFVGCNIKNFANTSKQPLNIAINNGLNRKSKVLEIGCGCCRVGYWFMDYLDQDCYCGIEPNEDMLAARGFILQYLAGEKRPRFDSNSEFDLSVFGESFDFIIAYSIWSHACKSQIETVVKQLQNHKPCTFIGTMIFPSKNKPDHDGNEWVGASHESYWNKKNYQDSFNKIQGTVAHSYEWLDNLCKENGCILSQTKTQYKGQKWIKISTE